MNLVDVWNLCSARLLESHDFRVEAYGTLQSFLPRLFFLHGLAFVLAGCETSPESADVASARALAQEAPPDAGWLSQVNRALNAREYWASDSGLGLQAPNRRHSIRTYFSAEGIRVVDRSAEGDEELIPPKRVPWGLIARTPSVGGGENAA